MSELDEARPSPASWPAVRRLAAAATLVLVVGCGAQRDEPSRQAAAAPPPEVGVVTVELGPVGLVDELPGRLEASRVAQVRARATGILQKRLFREGSDVKAGQPLFLIDPAPLRATLASAQASLARAQANLAQATAQAERYKPLVEANAVSQQEFVNAQAAQKQAEADVAAGRASVQTAQINLGYASVNAPIAGRIGRALVTEGALVGQGEATQLAVVQQIDPIYVNFTQPAAEALRLRAAIEKGRLAPVSGRDAGEVRVVLEDGSVHPQAGRLLFSDLTVDPTSGQITLRAELPNPQGALLPGLYVRVRLEQAQAQQAVLLPQPAVARASQGDSVRIVGADGRVETRSVRVGGSQAGRWVVLEGLKGGEQVIVDGFQKIRAGAPVKPVPWRPPGAAPVAGAPASAASAAPAAAASAAGR
ncbi:MAG TPA: efflux RND transporter periplasmic adaptor subunit [Methylibium sp.]|uniref:efflux RND transporter periplasmic adaptor subunit n=1 Tax=Methylibium sp. TaxID=2067992 RepID=UPI002DBFC74B|nr:efflux RND transporter periplasmic adaptor subunit [Methylibium sp.]HEU4458311.1 efflux RND transporter periplasmic adaptor subunit [Methylibium sp.]